MESRHQRILLKHGINHAENAPTGKFMWTASRANGVIPAGYRIVSANIGQDEDAPVGRSEHLGCQLSVESSTNMVTQAFFQYRILNTTGASVQVTFNILLERSDEPDVAFAQTSQNEN